jgi:hypothetical protein
MLRFYTLQLIAILVTCSPIAEIVYQSDVVINLSNIKM